MKPFAREPWNGKRCVMPEHIKYEDDELFNPETHHEHSDVPVRPLIKAIIIFVVASVLTHFFIKFLYDRFAASESKRMDPPQTQVARPSDAAVPKNQPLLQPFPRKDLPPNAQTPVVDLIEMRKVEDQVLNNYGWNDKEHGVVHIPIAEAKKMLVAKQAGPQASPPAGAASVPAPPALATPAPTTTGGAH
jgi:hypothetical protein